MSMSISPIASLGSLSLPPITAAGGAAGAAKTDFGTLVSQGLDKLQATQTASDTLAVQATTGGATDISNYMIAANEATAATQLTVAVRNKAVDAFNQIMQMQI